MATEETKGWTSGCKTGGCAAKYPAADLIELTAGLELAPDPNLLVGFGGNDDAGVYRLSDDLALVQTADFIPPLCEDPFVFGQIAAANALSDVYAMGGRPLTALNLCCFPPPPFAREILASILAGGLAKLREAGVALVGGHTVRDERLLYGLAVTGTIHPGRIRRNDAVRTADALVLTKALGTGVMVSAARSGRIDADRFAPALASMLQLNAAASELAVRFGCSAMTDITGFGLAVHAWWMVAGSERGIRLQHDQLPSFATAIELMREGLETSATAHNARMLRDRIERSDRESDPALSRLIFDPQTSGGLLISIAPSRATELVGELRAAGMESACIVGEVFATHEPRLVLES